MTMPERIFSSQEAYERGIWRVRQTQVLAESSLEMIETSRRLLELSETMRGLYRSAST